MAPKNTYFTAYFNKKGELIGAVPPTGKKVRKIKIEDLMIEDVTDIRELSVILKPGCSPCCIKQGTRVYCWC